MKRILILLLPLVMVCCKNESSSQNKAAAMESEATLASTPDDATVAPSKGGISQELSISVPEVTAKSGDQICVDLLVSGFEKLLSMQYTIAWNKNILTFKELKNFSLPHLDVNDFGTTRTQEGMVTIAWIDDSLKGVTVPDGSSVYQVCFEVKGKAGERSYVKITDRPTTIEVINVREKSIPLKKKAGGVTIL